MREAEEALVPTRRTSVLLQFNLRMFRENQVLMSDAINQGGGAGEGVRV